MEQEARKKRVLFLRKLILFSVGMAVLVPVMISLLLAMRYDRAMDALNKSREELTWYKNHFDARQAEEETAVAEAEPAAEQPAVPEGGMGNGAAEAPSAEEEQADADEEEEWDGIRRVYLTFDDGPSASTDQILSTLSDYGVKATFFVTGKPDKRYAQLYNRIVEEGHTLAMHSYSHRYSTVYESLDSFQTDLHKLQNFLYDTTGVWCKIYRFPGGSSNKASSVDMQELIDYLGRENIRYFDWNVDSGDASGSIGTWQIADNVIRGIPRFHNAVVLMHDAQEKRTTLEALPMIIEAVQEMDNTVFAPIDEDTFAVHHTVN